MLELMICSLFTILPDYLYRRYGQGKRLGREITFYSVWYEFRYGITTCLMLTVALITVIFYFHPSSTNVTAYFRTIPILPETNGRVAEVFVGFSDQVEKGAPLFKLDSTKPQAAFELATRQLVEVDAAMVMAKVDIAAAEGDIQEAKGSYKQALEELQTKEELQRRNADVVTKREIERLRNAVEARQGALTAAEAAKQSAETKLSTLLPAQRASAEAAQAQAQVELNKMTVYAGVTGHVEQFSLRVGDVVNPLMRPAGILIPSEAGRLYLVAGFNQIEAQVVKVGMTAEATCASNPLTIIPLVVTQVQDFISAGQFRTSEQLIDPQQTARPGTLLVFLQPLFEGGLDKVTPGSSCVANAYTNNHDSLAQPNIGWGRWLFLHMVDTVSIVHAMILRLQALVLPIKVLVFGGH
ncbi:putative multidrug resistance efflux pump [Candidatus Filomicrobium marinum]|nr:HlyD family secretion protein [Candidatus Filomicrobium marinum]CFX59525.1 putative multidrug resistance efflux pump [Candidatus Filomicrobium marinum]